MLLHLEKGLIVHENSLFKIKALKEDRISIVQSVDQEQWTPLLQSQLDHKEERLVRISKASEYIPLSSLRIVKGASIKFLNKKSKNAKNGFRSLWSSISTQKLWWKTNFETEFYCVK